MNKSVDQILKPLTKTLAQLNKHAETKRKEVLASETRIQEEEQKAKDASDEINKALKFSNKIQEFLDA